MNTTRTCTRASDDADLDLLGTDHFHGYTEVDEHAELTRVLAAGRREIRSAPIPDLVDLNTAVRVISAARDDQPRPSYIMLWILGAFLGACLAFASALVWGLPW